MIIKGHELPDLLTDVFKMAPPFCVVLHHSFVRFRIPFASDDLVIPRLIVAVPSK